MRSHVAAQLRGSGTTWTVPHRRSQLDSSVAEVLGEPCLRPAPRARRRRDTKPRPEAVGRCGRGKRARAVRREGDGTVEAASNACPYDLQSPDPDRACFGEVEVTGPRRSVQAAHAAPSDSPSSARCARSGSQDCHTFATSPLELWCTRGVWLACLDLGIHLAIARPTRGRTERARRWT